MGGLFKAPKPKVVSAVETKSNAEAEARAARVEAINRNRRGRSGLIATSERGVLGQSSGTKNLLGE